MKDLKLDFTNKKLLNEVVDDTTNDRLEQHVKVAVRSWPGDFFLNDDFGIDYDTAWSNKSLMKLYEKEQIEAIYGVTSVPSIEINDGYDTATSSKKFIINATIKKDNELINISEEVAL